MRVSRGEFRCASKVVAQSQCGFAVVNGNFAYHAMNMNRTQRVGNVRHGPFDQTNFPGFKMLSGSSARFSRR